MVPGALSRGAEGGPLIRAAVVVLAGLAVLALALLLLPLSRAGSAPPSLDGRTAVRLRGSGPLRAGAARVPIALAERPVLAGRPGLHRGLAGEPVYARALALEAGGVRMLVATLDALLVPGELEEEVLRRAALPADTCLLLAATHTHSGPGGTWSNPLAELAGNGRLDRGQRDAVAGAIAQALRGAIGSLQPAQLAVERGPWPEGPAASRVEGAVDPGLLAARVFAADGRTLAWLVVYAMHATSHPQDDPHVSADWPGKVSAAFEPSAVALVLQGAVGNATWTGTREELAPRIAAEVRRRLAGAPVAAELEAQCTVRIAPLPAAEASPRVPAWARRGAGNALFLLGPGAALQTRIDAGGLHLLGVPGEPVGELHDPQGAQLVGLADGYVGYVEVPSRVASGRGEAERTYYGPGLADALGLAAR